MDLQEIAKFRENSREQLGVRRMLAGMASTHIVALYAKVLSKRRFHRSDNITVLSMILKGLLLRKHWANCDQLE